MRMRMRMHIGTGKSWDKRTAIIGSAHSLLAKLRSKAPQKVCAYLSDAFVNDGVCRWAPVWCWHARVCVVSYVSYTHTQTHTQVTDASVPATRSTMTADPASTMPSQDQQNPTIDSRTGAPPDRKSMMIRHGDPSPEGLGEMCIHVFAASRMYVCMHAYNAMESRHIEQAPGPPHPSPRPPNEDTEAPTRKNKQRPRRKDMNPSQQAHIPPAGAPRFVHVACGPMPVSKVCVCVWESVRAGETVTRV